MSDLDKALLVTLVTLVGTSLFAALGWLIKSSRNEITRRLDMVELKLGSLDLRLTRVGSVVDFMFAPPQLGQGRRWTDRPIDDDGPA